MSKKGNLIQCTSIDEGKKTLIGLVKTLRHESKHRESIRFINECDFKFGEPYILDDDDFEIGFKFQLINPVKMKLTINKEDAFLHHKIEKIQP